MESSSDFRLCHPQNGAVQVYVLSSGQLGMKTGTYFKQRANTAINPCPAVGWSRDSRKDLQKRAFARSIASDNAEDLTSLKLE